MLQKLTTTTENPQTPKLVPPATANQGNGDEEDDLSYDQDYEDNDKDDEEWKNGEMDQGGDESGHEDQKGQSGLSTGITVVLFLVALVLIIGIILVLYCYCSTRCNSSSGSPESLPMSILNPLYIGNDK